MSAAHRLCVSPCAAQRVAFARDFLQARRPDAPLLLIVPSPQAGARLLAEVLAPGDARFAWQRRTLDALARERALPELARDGRVPLSALSHEALVTRLVHELASRAELGRYAELAERPGFVRALARSLDELRLSDVSPERLAPHAPELARALSVYATLLDTLDLADRAHVYDAAARARASAAAPAPLLALDVPLSSHAEARFAQALCAGRLASCVTVALGDERSEVGWRLALPASAAVVRLEPTGDGDLARLKARLFGASALRREGPPATRGAVRVLSSPGEAREVVELTRGVLAAAAEGVPLDRMAILLRAGETYRAVVEEALARAQVPAHFADGVRRPLPAGRALLALLACARDGLSARAFAEYLSLGALPRGDGEPAVSPRKWERILAEAAVVEGRARWSRRLAAHAAALGAEHALLAPGDPRRAQLEEARMLLARLEAFAMPLLDALEALPEGGTWGSWIDALTGLAARALDEPEAVCEVVRELAPLAPVGPVSVRTVHRVLAARLASIVVPDRGHGAGKLFVGAVEDARGRAFDRVFVPGLAERVFPPRIAEDPLLPDATRRALGHALWLSEERVARERLLLRIAVGAASEQLWLSFPRFDVAHGRPRVPSFYGLEVLQAIDGTLPPFDELTRRAHPGAAARMGFPAPAQPKDAIDDAEYDLAMLAALSRAPSAERAGAARYLLEVSPHLARALRFRARRWESTRLTGVDGFVAAGEAGRALLEGARPRARAYSASALAQLAECPYRFYLQAVVGLAVRTDGLAADELDARQRGVLHHRVQRALLHALREEGLLPLAPERLGHARGLLDALLDEQAAALRDELAVSMDALFELGLGALRRDLVEWLARLATDTEATPLYFELGFGLPARSELDPASRREPVALPVGLTLAGAIDLVERLDATGVDGAVLRATDHKTTPVPPQLGIVAGGRSLQPLLYALALEQLFPEAKVASGRLYFCTAQGDFRSHEVPLDERSRAVAASLVACLDELVARGVLPAAPARLAEDPNRSACERCAYRVVCGPHEPDRIAQVKAAELARLSPLQRLRNLP